MTLLVMKASTKESRDFWYILDVDYNLPDKLQYSSDNIECQMVVKLGSF